MNRAARWLSLAMLLLLGLSLPAADDAAPDSAGEAKAGEKKKPEAPKSRFGAPPGATRLSPKHAIWVDTKRKLVIMDGEVCLREGQLEMFACPDGTKEHESIVSVNTLAYYAHAGLLAVGADIGNPVQFDPKYVPARGTKIEVLVLWYDKDGKKRTARAQEWIRNVETEEEMAYDWVFAGSGFWFDKQTGREHYLAEGGDFICVSNFSTATLDIPVKSTQANKGLLFEAFKKRIPPLKTPVRLVLRPISEKKKDTGKTAPEKKKAEEKESDEQKRQSKNSEKSEAASEDSNAGEPSGDSN